MSTVVEQVESEFSAMRDCSYGVLDDYVKSFQDWVQSVDFKGMAIEQLDQLMHWFITVGLPSLVEKAPTWVSTIVFTIIIPLLKKIDEAYLHAKA